MRGLAGFARLPVELDDVLELVDDFGHRRTMLVFLLPHALDEVDDLGTPLSTESRDRRSTDRS